MSSIEGAGGLLQGDEKQVVLLKAGDRHHSGTGSNDGASVYSVALQ
jgi:hypothetical protein